jgi:alcohol dehydrogenase class IV
MQCRITPSWPAFWRQSDQARDEALIGAMQQIAVGTGIETKLEQVGMAECDLERLADGAMLQNRLLGNYPRELVRANARAIYAL